jgi:cytochrome c oxidase subunit 2
MPPPSTGFRRSTRFTATTAIALGTLLWAVSFTLRAQEQAPERRDITITAKEFRFTPSHIEVRRDDLLRLTVKSEDVAYGFTIDAYRVAKRVPAGGSVVLELRADREGTFAFYSNMTNDSRHAQMRGELVVRKP